MLCLRSLTLFFSVILSVFLLTSCGGPVSSDDPGAQDQTPAPVGSRSGSIDEMCAQPGVVLCQGFDTPSAATDIGQISAGSASTPTIDTTVFHDGGGSLRIDVPSLSAANAGGNWNTSFTPIGEGEELYLHYAIRYDQDYVDVNKDVLTSTGSKQFILWNGSSSCASMEISHSTLYGRGYPWLYSACGSGGFDIPIANFDYLIMQGSAEGEGYNCNYHAQSSTGLGCPDYQADIWWRFYLKLKINKLGGTPCDGNVVESWWKKGDGPWAQAVNRQSTCLRFNRDASEGYERMMMTAYMTNKPSNVDHETMSVWYDDLVLSTKPLIEGIDSAPVQGWPPE